MTGNGRSTAGVTRGGARGWIGELGQAIAHAARQRAMLSCALVVPVLYAIVVGMLFASTLVLPIGGFGAPDASLIAFPAIVIAATGLLLTPVEMTGRVEGSGRRAYAASVTSVAALATDLVARVLLVVAGSMIMLAIGTVAFGIRPAGGALTAASTVLAVALGAAAFVAVGQLLSLVLASRRRVRVLGHVLLYPFVLASGAVVPVGMLPGGVRDVAVFSPLTQLVTLLRETWLAGDWSAIWLPVVVLSTVVLGAQLLLARTVRSGQRLSGGSAKGAVT